MDKTIKNIGGIIMKKIINKFNEQCVKMFVSVKGRTTNEKGATTVEWVGLAFVILSLMFIISETIKGDDGGIASAITGKIKEIVGKVGQGE